MTEHTERQPRTRKTTGAAQTAAEAGTGFNPDLSNAELMRMQPGEIRAWKAERDARKAAIEEGNGQSTATAEPTPAAPKKADGIYIRKGTLGRTGVGLLGVGGLIGTGILAGAMIFGGDHNNGGSNPSAEPSTRPNASASAEPSNSVAPSEQPSASTEVSGWTAKATDTEHGWARANLDLTDVGGPKIEVDRLDYQPSKDKTKPLQVSLMANSIIDGDVDLDGVWTTDSDGQTGSRILNQKDGSLVDSQWAFQAYENFDPKYTDLIMKLIEKNQLANGCGLVDGCKESIAQTYKADGTLVAYDSTNTPAESAAPSQSTDANASEAPVCATPTPEPTPTPSCSCGNPEPHTTCIPGYDKEYASANGVLKNAKHFTAKGGEVYEIQGDVAYKKDGKIIENFDNRGDTGAITYITLPVGEKIEVYMLWGGDVHKLNSCTTQEEANQLLAKYKKEVTANGHPAGTKVYPVK